MRIPVEIAPGIFSDDTTFSTGPVWAAGKNVRPWRGKMQTIGGWSAASADTVTGKCRTILSWANNDAELNIAFGTHSHLMVMLGGELYDITPAGLPAGAEYGAGPGFGGDAWNADEYGTPRVDFFPRTWSLSTYGETLIANPRMQSIFQWSNDPATPAAQVANAPAEVNFAMVVPERQLLAFGCNEEVSGDFNPLCIRFSNVEDITDWTTSPDNLAGEIILEGGGRIVAARPFGNGIGVWTDSAVYFGQFTGDYTQPWRFDRIEDNCGLISPNAVTVISQTAYWIAPDRQFRVWGLGVPPQIYPCPIRNDFADNVAEGQGDAIASTSISQFGEVWWFYPDVRDGNENSRFLAVSTVDGAWFQGVLPRTAASDAGVAGYPIMVSPEGNIFYHQLGNNANGGVLEQAITTGDFYLDEGGRQMMITRLYPDFENQQGALSLTISVRNRPQSTPVVKGPYTIEPGQSKVDIRATGAVVAVTFSGASNPSYMRLGKPVFEAVPTGER